MNEKWRLAGDVGAPRLWVALNPDQRVAYLTDARERAEQKVDQWAGFGISGTPADRDFWAGFVTGQSPLGPLADYPFEWATNVDITSRDYAKGQLAGIAAGIIWGVFPAAVEAKTKFADGPNHTLGKRK